MRTQTIYFPDLQTPVVFPNERSNLAQAISELGLNGPYQVIVLIGSEIDEKGAEVTRRAIQAICRVAEETNVVVICGGTDRGVMAEIGQIKGRDAYKFPLLGITPEALVTWPGGPHRSKFLGWGKQRWQLEPHYSHFILVPGSQSGDEAPWIAGAATMLSNGRRSVTILIGGSEISKKDIELSLENGRPVIALSRTGHLADELARQPNRQELIAVIPASAEQRIADMVKEALAEL